MILYLILVLLVVIAFFDLYWILRLVITRIASKLRPSISVNETAVTHSLCWTTDIDYFFHMNNGKYFREMDFGRFDFYFRSGCSAFIEKTPGMYVVQHGASIRYRRSINFLVPFKLETKLVFWDDRSLFFEQRFVSLHDGFVRAVALCRNTVVGGSVSEMMASLGINVPPPCPQDVTIWLSSQEVSSAKLREEISGNKSGITENKSIGAELNSMTNKFEFTASPKSKGL